MQTQETTKKAAPRMTLGAITRGRQRAPMRVVLYGTEGVGKSTWAGDAPSPIFLPVEEGSHHLDVARFPRPGSWGDVLDAIKVLSEERHDYQTLVIDTLDALEPLVWDRVCATRTGDSGKRVTSIEEYGFAKGYIYALDVWRELLERLDALRASKGMSVILIAHASLVTIKSPDTQDWQRHDLKLHHKSSALVREWAEHVLFATVEMATAKINNRTKVVAHGDRVIHTTSAAGWVAKTRSGAPPVLPLSWQAFAEAVDGTAQSADEVLARLAGLLPGVPEDKRAAVEKAITDARASSDPAGALAKVENRIRVAFVKEVAA